MQFPKKTALTLSLLALGSLGTFLSSAHAAEYTITDLGILPGGTSSVAAGVNDLGEVSGTADVNAGRFHAILYSGGVLQDLGGRPKDIQSFGQGINNSSVVAGYSVDANNNSHAVLFNHGVVTDIGPAGSFNSYAIGISNSGYVTGTRFPVAFLYRNGIINDIVGLPSIESWGLAVNNTGDVTGYNTDPSFVTHAFLYRNGVMTDLGALGGSRSLGHGINNSDTVVGEYINSAGKLRGFYSVNGVMTDIGALGTSATVARSINDAGQVVGLSDNAFEFHNGVMRDLNNLIAPNTGWRLVDATSINNLGQIVGEGIIHNQGHAYLLTPIIGSASPLTVTSTSPSSITLSWAAATGATGYKIYRSSASEAPHALASVAQITAYTDATAQPGITYTYYVTAMNLYGAGLPSNTITVTTFPTISNLKATPVSPSSIHLTWTPVSGVQTYTVSRSATSGGPYAAIGQAATAAFTDTNLQAATAYYYVVSTHSTNLRESNEATAFTLGLPSAPTNVIATPVSASAVHLLWTAGTSATSYTIYRSTISGSGRVAVGTTTSTRFNDANLTPSTQYYYLVVASNPNGSTASAEATALTFGLPNAPGNLMATPVSKTDVHLIWNASGTNAATYTVYRSTTSGTGRVAIGATTGLRFNDTNLKPATTYYYIVVASNPNGSNPSTEVSALTFAP